MNSKPEHSGETSTDERLRDSVETSEFEQLSQAEDVGLLREFWMFLKEEKRWWLTPIVLACLAITGLAWFTGTGAYPFIYSLF